MFPRRTHSSEVSLSRRDESYLDIDLVLPVSLSEHQSSDLGHPTGGRQRPDVQLEELFWVVVVGENTNVHSHSSKLTVSPASSWTWCTGAVQLK